MSLSIGIIGAGIGGLSTALACHHAGLTNLTVYDQSKEPTPDGAGVQLSPNATRILRALRVLPEIGALAFTPQFVHLRSARSGFLIAQLALGEFAHARYGAPYLNIHRGDLHARLTNALNERDIEIVYNRHCEQVDVTEQDVTVHFRTGEQAAHSVIIGADGIHSAVRGALIQDSAPRFTGHVAWRGLVAASDLPKNQFPGTVTAWMGPAKHFVHYYVRGGDFINFVGVVEDQDWREESWVAPADKAKLREDFSNWHPQISTLIEASKDVNRWALYDREPLTHWSHGRATLLGDACHPMLPYVAQGAAMAIEDAWVLARMLDQWEEDPAAGLVEYEKYRLPRTRRIQAAARAQGQNFHLSSPLAVWKRNITLSLGSRFLPELAMQRNDWIYSYDAVNGFE